LLAREKMGKVSGEKIHVRTPKGESPAVLGKKISFWHSPRTGRISMWEDRYEQKLHCAYAEKKWQGYPVEEIVCAYSLS